VASDGGGSPSGPLFGRWAWNFLANSSLPFDIPQETHSGEAWDEARAGLHVARLGVGALLNVG
jgi:hypothetical protein